MSAAFSVVVGSVVAVTAASRRSSSATAAVFVAVVDAGAVVVVVAARAFAESVAFGVLEVEVGGQQAEPGREYVFARSPTAVAGVGASCARGCGLERTSAARGDGATASQFGCFEG